MEVKLADGLVKLNVGRRVPIVPPFGESPAGAVALIREPSALAKAEMSPVALGDTGDCGELAQLLAAIAHAAAHADKVVLFIDHVLLANKRRPVGIALPIGSDKRAT
jgi:hypothetical protein